MSEPPRPSVDRLWPLEHPHGQPPPLLAAAEIAILRGIRMATTRSWRQWPWPFFLFSVLWGGFALTWSYRAWTKGRFNYGRRPGVPVSPETHPAIYWGWVIGAALAGLFVLALGAHALIRYYRVARDEPSGE